MEKILEGLVKGVLSGDTISISGKVDKMSDKAPEECLLSFNLINAPKVGSSNNKEEEPFGWESRNFLRGLVIGKVVKYTIDYRSGERCIGQIFLENKNINLELVKKGYAKVSGINKQNESFAKSEYYGKLQNFENEAKKNKENIWAEKTELEKHKRALTKFDDKDFDFKRVEDFCLGKEVEVMIEHVINCSSYILFIKDLNCFIRFNPRFLAIPNNTKEPVIYKSGKACVERLILHRDFKVKFYSVDENKNFVGDVLGVKGDLVLQILRGGYTKVFTGSSNVTNEELTNLKNAQQFAMNERLRLWKNHVGGSEDGKIRSNNNSVKSSDKASFDGLCIQVHSGDSISVKHKSTGEVIRVFLSHLKAPKLANPNTNEADQPWAWQAKEYLRKNFVGKRVFCEYDFTRVIEGKDKSPERQMNFFSVIKISEKEGASDVNINAELIKHGYASYVTPKVDDTQNASKYLDQYSGAFTEAKEKKVGVHSTKSPGVYNYSDLFAANKQKVKEFKDFLVGQRNTPCVVEHVITGTRLKLRIESKKCMIPFNLLGIKTFSKDKNNTELCDKISQLGVDFANESILQREGTVDIIQGDRVGNYFGYLYFNGENYGASLIKNGLAVVNIGMAGNFSHLNLYKKAEEAAMENKVNIWKYDGLVSMLKEGSDGYDTGAAIKLTEKTVDSTVKVSEFVDFSEFYVNYTPNKNLDKICEVLGDYDIGKKKAISLEAPIRKGVLCAAKYYNDEQYYRAITIRTFKEDKHEVEFIDYGTIEEIAGSDLIKLDSSIAQFEPQAVSCELAHLKFSEHSMKKALVTMKTFGQNQSKQYFAKVVYCYSLESRTKNGIIIYNSKDKNIKDSLQYELLEIGLAKLDKKKPVGKVELDALNEAQKKAKTKGVGMWADNERSDDEADLD